MKFLSVRKGASGPLNIGGNELTLAGVVKEDLTCSGSSLPKKKGGPARPPHSVGSQARKRPSSGHKLSSLTMKQYPLLWDFIRLNRKDI